MIGLEQGLYSLAAVAGAILWWICVVRNRTLIWGFLELWCRANKLANMERRRVMAGEQGTGCVTHG